MNPLKLSLFNYVWDFGSLSEKNEIEYMKNIFKFKSDEDLKNKYVEIIYECHNYVKNEVEKSQSSVSLRDIERVNKIFHFCFNLFKEIKQNEDKLSLSCEDSGYSGDIDKEIFLKSIIITISINYIFRLYNPGNFN